MTIPFTCLYRRALLWLLLVGPIAGCDWGASGSGGGAEEEHHVLVRTALAETRALEETVDGIGRSEALPQGLVTLTPAIQGHVETISAELGDELSQGDVIVQLDTIVASADVAERKANRDTLKAALDLLTAQPRPEERRGLEIAIDQAKQTVALAQTALDRLRPLETRKEVSAAQMYEAEQALVRAQLGQKSAEAQLDLLLAGPRVEAVAEAKSRLAAAQEALSLSEEHLSLHTIRSPIDGVLDSLTCHPGQTVSVGVAIGEVVDTRRVNVVVWLPPNLASRVHVGQTARLQVPGAPPESPAPLTEEDRAASEMEADQMAGADSEAEGDQADSEMEADRKAAAEITAELMDDADDEPGQDSPDNESLDSDSADSDSADKAMDPPASDAAADATSDADGESDDDADSSGDSLMADKDAMPADGEAWRGTNAPVEAEDETAETDGAIEGKVASIGRIVDPQTGNLPVRILVDNADGRIAVGQTLPVTIVVHRRIDELVVPTLAMVDLGEGPMVVVVREGKTVPLHPTSVATHGLWTIVAGTDLAPGEEVVIDGGFNLPEGTEVEIEGQKSDEADTPAVAEAGR